MHVTLYVLYINSSCGETEMPIFISKWMDSWHALYLEMYTVTNYLKNGPVAERAFLSTIGNKLNGILFWY